MNNTAWISCDIGTTDPDTPLGIEIWLNDQRLLDISHVQQDYKFSHAISDTDAEHELKFVLKNKTSVHTQIDSNNNIVKDACLTVTNLQFDEIPLGQTFIDLATYVHTFNNTGDPVQQKFYGQMGCNGTVTLPFSTPIYMWLLEHM